MDGDIAFCAGREIERRRVEWGTEEEAERLQDAKVSA